MKKGELTTMEKLKIGDVFSFCQGGINFEKMKGFSDEGHCYAKVKNTNNEDKQTVDKKFPVFFIKHSTNGKEKRIKKPKRKYIQLCLFS